MTIAESQLDVAVTAAGTRPAAPEGGPLEPLEFEEEMQALHRGIEARLATAAPRVIQFTASRPGEGTSTIVRAYARTLARMDGRSIVIVDANDLDPGQHLHFGLSADVGWDDAVATGDPVRRAVAPTAHPNLFVAPLSGRRMAAALVDGPGLARVFAALRQEFQAILVDSGPVFRPGTAALAAVVDGVVLVVEAGKTRWPLAVKAKDAIDRRPGPLLGVVLNRRRDHVPRALRPRS